MAKPLPYYLPGALAILAGAILRRAQPHEQQPIRGIGSWDGTKQQQQASGAESLMIIDMHTYKCICNIYTHINI